MVETVRTFFPTRLFVASTSLAAAIFLAPTRLVGQSVGVITGTISDSSGIALRAVELTLDETFLRAESDENGVFRISGVPVGPGVLRARRLGFRPAQTRVEVPANGVATVALRLAPIAAMLEAVVIGANRMNYTGRLAGYYQRLERKSGGYFITRAEIDRENPHMLGELLQRVPGIREVRGRGRTTGIRMRGRTCWPLVWFDGNPMPAGEVDIDSFAPNTIQGIELYLGSTTAPARYTYTRDVSSCGTILIWSRGIDTDPINPPPALVSDLERLVASASVFTPEQVERQARLDPNRPLNLDFPPALFAEGMRGLVVAEFVVDTLGQVETETVGIVSSTHPLFTAAVRSALEGAAYVPAMKRGQPVRQIVQQPFDFVVHRK